MRAFGILLLLAACAQVKPADQVGDPPDLAFNGRDLQGFYVYVRGRARGEDPKGVISVRDGTIHVTGEELGYFATSEQYADYHLVVEFRWGAKTHPPRVDKARDSGILFHASGPDKIWPRSIEFQIIEGGTGDIILVDGASMALEEALRPRLASNVRLSPDGARIVRGRVNWPGRAPDWKDAVGFRGPADREKPVGEWNRLDLHVQGDTFRYLVNGHEVVRGRGASDVRGHIAFQSEWAEIDFRRIELFRLPAPK